MNGPRIKAMDGRGDHKTRTTAAAGQLLGLSLLAPCALDACAPVAGRVDLPSANRTAQGPVQLQASGAPALEITGGGVSPRVSLLADAAMKAPLKAKFTASLPGGGTAEWQFSGGGAASGPSVSHTFYQPGRYSVQARMTAGGHTYLATVPLDVRSNGPEQAAMVLLQDSGSLALSARGSVVYAPYTPRFTLDGQPTTPLRQRVEPGTHTVQVSISAHSGPVSRSYSYRSGPALSDSEFSRQRSYEAEVLRLTNQARAEGWDCVRQANGGKILPALHPDVQLQVAARAQSVGMALGGYFAHRSAVDSSLPGDRIRASGYQAASDAENIAAGQPTPAEVVSAWKKSPGHCPNIMGDYDDIGVAYARQDGSPFGEYWTQVFGRKGE